MTLQCLDIMESDSLEIMIIVGTIVVSVVAFLFFLFLFIIRDCIHSMKQSKKAIMVMEVIIKRKEQDNI